MTMEAMYKKLLKEIKKDRRDKLKALGKIFGITEKEYLDRLEK